MIDIAIQCEVERPGMLFLQILRQLLAHSLQVFAQMSFHGEALLGLPFQIAASLPGTLSLPSLLSFHGTYR